jgi:predicted O-linked N-acetylglucosamine transferase (SPINDLY family)
MRGLISEAEQHHRRCIELKPDYHKAWNNLGNDLRDQGRLSEARDAYRMALQLEPDYMRAHSNLLFSMLYDMADSQAVYDEHLQWDSMHAAGLMPLAKDDRRDADPERKLRIGYVSPDFREHSVAYFIEPILAAHERNHFEIYCFSDVHRPDAVTARLKGYADKWLDISACSDEAVAEMIRQECIDILIDLAGHTSHHRLMVFARKPAPVQATYLGYPATTGMSAMDYRLTDEWADPAGQERYHSEQLLRLPGGFLCYTPSSAAPQVASLPHEKNGYISFGCFNHLSKVTPEVIVVWSQILQQLPGSHLVLKHISLQDAKVRERYLQMFEENGVNRDRIDTLDWSASVREHLSCYSLVDIALDTFPYNGTTTSCEALWMGVPVVCLKGKVHAGRVGLSLLESGGRQEWVAGSREGYVSLALQLAADPEGLIDLRAGLRQELAASSLCDRSATTHALEDVYRNMWQERRTSYG